MEIRFLKIFLLMDLSGKMISDSRNHSIGYFSEHLSHFQETVSFRIYSPPWWMRFDLHLSTKNCCLEFWEIFQVRSSNCLVNDLQASLFDLYLQWSLTAEKLHWSWILAQAFSNISQRWGPENFSWYADMWIVLSCHQTTTLGWKYTIESNPDESLFRYYKLNIFCVRRFKVLRRYIFRRRIPDFWSYLKFLSVKA